MKQQQVYNLKEFAARHHLESIFGAYAAHIYIDDEDTPTGFIDGGIDGVDKPEDEDFKYLVFPKTGDRLKIDYMGVVIGRSSKTASYVIRGNDLVSRPHCKVYKENGKYYVHDCTSKNGTFVDGVQVMPDKDVEIKSGSTLLVANERFVFDK